MKKWLKRIGVAVLVLALGAAGFYFWARSKANSRLDRVFQTHKIDFPVPFPLSEEEIADLEAPSKETSPPGAGEDKGEAGDGDSASPLADVDLEGLALERAIKRGEHLVGARYGCVECHGADFAGGTMMDEMPVARLFGPNLTKGQGGVTADYTVADWDRAVRHGVLRDGRPMAMPSEDYFLMSDQELSDIIAYIRAQPDVERASKPRELGRVGTVLMALGKMRLSAEELENHQAKHAALPPLARDTVEFGGHLAAACTGCHRIDFSGGPIHGGSPDWPPAANLTMHSDGLEGWAYEDFVKAMRETVNKEGKKLRAPMSLLAPYAKQMTDTELKAMWTYFQSVAKKPTGK